MCGIGKARMINSSTVVSSEGLSKHSQCLVLGMLSADILFATREIHFPIRALLSGCTLWEAELELRKQTSSSAVPPVLESCLPEFASRETLLWTEQICTKLYSQSQYDLFAKLNTGVCWFFFWTAEVNKSKLCEVIVLCLSKRLQLHSQSRLPSLLGPESLRWASTRRGEEGLLSQCCVLRSVAMRSSHPSLCQ